MTNKQKLSHKKTVNCTQCNCSYEVENKKKGIIII